jgi:hypothetical protein
MLDCAAPSNPARRRLLSAVAAVGLSFLAAGCDRKLPIVPTPLAGAPPRRAAPAPLAPMKPPAAPGTLIGATFGRVLALEGITIDRVTVEAGNDLRIWLHWQSVAPSQEDLRSVGRVVTSNGRVLASEDDQIGGRKRHLTRWQIGERVVDEMRLRLTPNTTPGEYGLAVGVLRPDNQTPVPVTARAAVAQDWQEDAILVGTIEVTAG